MSSLTYEVFITCDGGCQPNPGKMYGSFESRRGPHKFLGESKFQLGDGTNNRAEILALKTALEKTTHQIASEGFDVGIFNLTVETDSQLLSGWINRKMGFNDRELQKLFLGAHQFLKMFKSYSAFWTPRENIERKLGH